MKNSSNNLERGSREGGNGSSEGGSGSSEGGRGAAMAVEQRRKYNELQLQLQHMMQMFQSRKSHHLRH
ncbi:hypothetical protein PVK06_035259 [Gossypium arboreum]|uniref:Uncharacterized protein n=1 Tax=Gossypium arboreum TaxID=29729 RepID=A0ABR0NGC4_GOSAR|nr:hypothetical protein PVK06_035259 [Gossypium arboreum]